MRSKIPIHHNELLGSGIEVLSFTELSNSPKISHRDDHYMLMLQQKGASIWSIDFKEWRLEGSTLCFVAPGQVHRYQKSENAEGWLIFIEPELIPSEYRIILDTFMYHQQVMRIGKDHPIFTLTMLLQQFVSEVQQELYQSILHSYVSTLTGMFTSSFMPHSLGNIQVGSYKYQLVISFKNMIKHQFREVKQVKAYAAQLNITPLYLNEVTKEVTGFVASYWIQKEILLEAQRLLFYTDIDVKEIAFALGFEDHQYFSRFFKKNIGTTASIFRQKKPLFVQS